MPECDFNKITLRHGYSPVNLLHIFRKPFFKNTSVGSLLPLKHVIWKKVINYCCSILHLKGLWASWLSFWKEHILWKHFSKFLLCNLFKVKRDVTVWKVSKNGVFSGLYFPVFGLNAEIYEVNLRIQSKYGKIRTRKNSVFGNFFTQCLILE